MTTKKWNRAVIGADGEPEDLEVLPMQGGLRADDHDIRREAGMVLEAVVERLEKFQTGPDAVTGVVGVSVVLGTVTTMSLREAVRFWHESLKRDGRMAAELPPGYFRYRLYIALAPTVRPKPKEPWTPFLEAAGAQFCFPRHGESCGIVRNSNVVPREGETSRWLECVVSDELHASLEKGVSVNFANDVERVQQLREVVVLVGGRP